MATSAMSIAAAAAMVFFVPHVLCAQVIGGAVIEATTRQRLPRMPIYLLRETSLVWVVARAAEADVQGVFQLIAPEPGVYRLAFGDSVRPISMTAPDTLAADTSLVRQFLVPLHSHVFRETEVDLPARVIPSGGGPRYPTREREAGIGGTVHTRIVVDTTGRVDPTSIEIVRASAPAFGIAVKEYLPGVRFVPAKWREYAVRQLIIQPFTFGVAR